jgi:hypothetical protein
MIVAPQNAIPVEDGMCFHDGLLFEKLPPYDALYGAPEPVRIP